MNLREHPGGGRADAAHRIGLAGRGVPGAELGQPKYRGMDSAGVNSLQHVPQVVVWLSPGDRGAGAERGRASLTRVSEQRCSDRGGGRCGQERTAARSSESWNLVV